jgi:ankyrin repeat protein
MTSEHPADHNDAGMSDEELAFAESVFDLAREGSNTELEALIGRGVPVNLTNSKGDSLLILAAYRERAETVEMLLRRGADIDRINDNGQTALVAAVFRNNAGIVSALLAAGANPAIGTNTALAVARQFGLTGMERLLA